MAEVSRVTAPSSQSWLWVMIDSLPVAGGRLRAHSDGRRFRDLEKRVADGEVGELVGPPLYLPSMYGKKRGDLLWTCGGPPLASDRFVDALRASGCTGFTTYDVEVRYRRGTPVPGYQGLVITGRTGRWWETQEPPLIVVRTEPVLTASVRGADPGEGGDGSDLFREEGSAPGFEFWMSGRAVEALRSAGVRNIEVTPAHRYEHRAQYDEDVLLEMARRRLLAGLHRAACDLVERRMSQR